ncbi:MAG: hypothetical protein Tp158DCM1228761_27 [Prokaryotic dsDNA virus sp.]|nr:MAG: hypothetical protein Tp158DCM1228761_27 [Prokaryotic dsDNA virus sp.]|tara:strand:- start:2099 stop:2473 length:375 start_codon:yes stop_codon:yes gene_type:complete
MEGSVFKDTALFSYHTKFKTMTKREQIIKELTRRMQIAKDTQAIGREKYLATLIDGVKNEFKPAYLESDKGKKYSTCFDNMETCGCETSQLEWWNYFGDYVEHHRPTCYNNALEYADEQEQKNK